MNTKENPHRPKIGLALGSGLARGWAHIGAIRALENHGFKPDIITGTSIGALVGGAYTANKMAELEEWAYSLNKMRIIQYLDLRVRSGGIIGGKRIYALLREYFGDIRIEHLPHPYVAIAADMATGHEVWLRRGRLIDALRASFSLPGVFPPVFSQGRWLVDGALVNPVPVSACQALGANMTIAINLNADIIGKVRRPGSTVPSVLGYDALSDDPENQVNVDKGRKNPVVNRLFSREADNPSLFGTMVSALNIVQDRLSRSRLAGDPPDVQVAPRIGHIGLLEFERVDELIKAGEEAVERAMPEIKDAYAVLCSAYSEREDEV